MSKEKIYPVDRELIKRALKEKGVTLADMADAIGRNKQALSRAIKGPGLSMTAIISIADYLNISTYNITGEVQRVWGDEAPMLNRTFDERQGLDRNATLRDFINCHGFLCGAEVYSQYTPQERGYILKALMDALGNAAKEIERQRELLNDHHVSENQIDGKEESDGQH